MASIVPHTTFVVRRFERASGENDALSRRTPRSARLHLDTGERPRRSGGRRLGASPQPILGLFTPTMAISSRMRPAYYPAMLDLAGRDALLVGGGEVAAQKARPLLDAGVRLRIVAVTPARATRSGRTARSTISRISRGTPGTA